MVAFNSAVLLSKIESSFRVDPTPTPSANAMLIIEPPSFSAEANRIQRAPARASISKYPGRTGRIQASIEFVHEVIGSGVDDASAPPPVDALLRACGLARTDIEDPGYILHWARQGNVGRMSFAAGGTSAYTPDYVRYYTVTCTTGGGSGTAVVSVTSPAMDLPNGTTLAAINVTGTTITNGTEITLGNGGKVTPTINAALTVGDAFVIMMGPEGSLYTPVSTGFESLTQYLYYEGLLHKMHGARGSFSLEAVAGEIPKFSFTMTGDWVDPTDAAIPTDAIYTDLEPPVLEYANVRIDNNLATCPVNLALDIANELNIRECANGSQGYAGGQITGRSPTVSFDPDFNTEATYPFWNKFKNATEVDFTFNIGTERGNMLHVLSHIQFSQNGYGNRNNSRIYEIEAEAVSRAGDDEIALYFY